MRCREGVVAVLACVFFASGCAEKQAADPGEVVREETLNRLGPQGLATGPTSHDPSQTVRCRADAEAGLHVQAPPGSSVTVPEDAGEDAEAQIVVPREGEGTPLRTTKSLGFIGDNPLTPGRTYGGPWNAPDAVLPKHRHVEPRYGGRFYGSGYGYRSYGGYRAPSAPPPPRSAITPSAGNGGSGSWGGSHGGGAPVARSAAGYR